MDLRVGVHTGTVHIGILGLRKWQFDIFSDDVNIASILEATGTAGYDTLFYSGKNMRMPRILFIIELYRTL